MHPRHSPKPLHPALAVRLGLALHAGILVGARGKSQRIRVALLSEGLL